MTAISITCPVNCIRFLWEPPDDTHGVYLFSQRPQRSYSRYSVTCPAGHDLDIELDANGNPTVSEAQRPESDKFWKEFGKNTLNESLKRLDDRSTFMITTCAALIVLNLGLVSINTEQNIIINLGPQFVFIISAIFFVFSIFPYKKKFNLQSPSSIESAYNSWLRWKIVFNYLGFGLFLAGLFVMTVVNITIIRV